VVNYLLEGEKLFALLTRYAATRNADLSEMLKRYVDVTDGFATLICALTCMLSDQATKGGQDRVVRDLMADAFDFLYEARSLTLKSNVTVYQYFSLGTHPNRGAVLERIHGHGDKFVLGSIGSPHKAETFDQNDSRR
jgi:hypothetical protein